MKPTLAKGFLLVLVSGSVLLGLTAAGTEHLPESLRILRILIGIPFVLLAPGFALQAALFPHPGELDGLTRAAFSFGLSIAVTPIVLIALTWMGLGMYVEPIAVSLGALIAVCALVMFIRRRRSPAPVSSGAAERADLRTWWASQDRFSRWILGILGAAAAVAVVSGIRVAQEAPAEPFTEFFLLDSRGLTMEYPRDATAGVPIVVNLGIANHEQEQSLYRIIAVTEGDRALATSETISLADGESWRGELAVVLPDAGNGQQVEFLLERIGDPWPYRTLRIWMDIAPAAASATAAPDPTATPG